MGKKLLIVDDSAFMRIVLKDIVAQAGYESVEAANGAAAVEKYREVRPDLVIMNIVMPEMYGVEALKLIKKFDPAAKAIMCSAMGNQYHVISSIQAGALDFIVKPFDSARLLEAIRRALSKT